MVTKDLAICIKKTDYSDTSQIVTLLTRSNGKLSAIAKGSRRAKSTSFGGTIELFSYGEVMLSIPKSESLATLTEFDQRPVFVGMSRNLFNLNSGLFAVEIVNYLTEQYDPHPELFDLLYDFLADIQVGSDKQASLGRLIKFQFDFLKELGVGLVFERCVNCKQKFNDSWSEVWFCSEMNGLICRDCEAPFIDKVRLPKSMVMFLNDMDSVEEVDFKQLSQMEKLIIRHFTWMLHKPPRTAKYFNDIL